MEEVKKAIRAVFDERWPNTRVYDNMVDALAEAAVKASSNCSSKGEGAFLRGLFWGAVLGSMLLTVINTIFPAAL